MCGRYAAARDTATLVEEFQVETVIDAAPDPNYNVAPTNQVAFVVERPVEGAAEPQRQLRVARWGLVPSWAKDPTIGARMINARWENAAEKPAFRSAFAKRRCLIPADGYFEWYLPAGGRPGAGKPRKQPYFIHRVDGASLALAGLYEFWRPSPDDEWLVTVTVLTTDSIGPLAAIHDRMPVLIEPSGYSRWLDPAARVEAGFDATLAVDLLTAYPVSTAVNSVRNNSPELLAPIPAEDTEIAPDTLP
ncbi:MAG TPA: SOS response-associated peptidase [Candidatus Limnocylindrales bacterium]|nr:SOS response-associated peptidase [Candidatus Limnocylindrales bacterium]